MALSHCKGSASAYTIQSLIHTVSQEIFIAPTIYQKRLYPRIKCAAAAASVASVRLCRWQPTRLRRPWDSPGKNTGVGCPFLLQCMKVKRESEVAQSCPTLSDPRDCSLSGSSVHGICRARVLEWGAIAFSKELSVEVYKAEKSTSS